MLAVRQRPETVAPSHGSRTMTLTSAPPVEGDTVGSSDGESSTVGALRLNGGARTRRRVHVEWEESVVDNEGCGRKSSKSECNAADDPLLMMMSRQYVAYTIDRSDSTSRLMNRRRRHRRLMMIRTRIAVVTTITSRTMTIHTRTRIDDHRMVPRRWMVDRIG